MTGRKRLGLAITAMAIVSVVAVAPVRAAEETPPAPAATVRIGMSGTLFRDVPDKLLVVVMKPLGSLMESQTGVKGATVPFKSSEELAAQLDENKVQLAVFQGFEFAWARQKHPKLQPLIIAVNHSRHLKAMLVVREDSAAKELADLQGRTLAMPTGTREHCRFFLDRRCEKCGQEPQAFFDKITKPATAEDALDDVVDNGAHMTIVDDLALDCYKRRKPARFAKLKILTESEVFPAGVIAYRPGAVDDDIAKKVREGMVKAHETALGRQLMVLWKLTSFENVPADYDQTLTDILKAYPAPKRKSAD